MAELPSEEQIIDALTSSGFLLEQQVALILDRYGYSTRLSPSYIDPDEKKQREIDVIGYKNITLADVDEYPICHIIVIECKSTPQTHVAFTREWTPIERRRQPNEIRLNTLSGPDGPKYSTSAWSRLHLREEWEINRINLIHKGVQIVRIERKNSTFTARNVLPEMGLPPIKAAFDNQRRILESQPFRDGVVFPACVIGGSLKIGKIDEDRQIEMRDCEFISMQYDNRASWTGTRGYSANYFDVVPIHSLERWLQHVENVVGRMNRRAKQGRPRNDVNTYKDHRR